MIKLTYKTVPAQPAEEMSVDKFSSSFPLEIFVIRGVIGFQIVQIFGKFFWRAEVVHVDERIIWSNCFVVRFWRTHYDWNYV